MSDPAPTYESLDDWIAREAVALPLDPAETFNAAVDRAIDSLGSEVELLGLGEAMHGWPEILVLRNRLFQRLVEAHGYSAIAVESSFPRGRFVNEYVAGRGPASFDAVQDTGFSHGFGKVDANRHLVEWMRRYNADPAHGVKLQFYGFDSPTEMTATDSPRQLLYFVLDYLAAMNVESSRERRTRIDELLGNDADWENPAASFDPSKGIGLSPPAASLRIEAEDLITELRSRRPQLIASGGETRYWEAEQYGSLARQMLTYHACLARESPDRIAELLALRDLMMADNLAYTMLRERGRGKVLAFAHNSHLKCGKAEWQLGPHALAWWPAGSHARAMLGERYSVIGSGVGVLQSNGIGPPEPATLEARLTAAPGPTRFIPTTAAQRLPPAALSDLPTRSASPSNPGYFPFTARSLREFDALVVLD